MYPEAGGSSSFARHAFNEMVSFIAAWGQMLNYMITVAISAYFVPHYLAVFWEPLAESPGDIIGGAVLIAALALINIRGTEESARLNLVLAIADLATQVVLVAIGIVLVLSPEVLVDNIHLGVAPSWSDFALGVAVGMIAYTGIETISNMAEEAKDAARTIPRSVGLTVAAVLGALPADPDRRPLGDAGHPGRRRPLHDGARHRVRQRPDPRHRREPRPQRRPDRKHALLRRHPRRRDPADRDQRGIDRRLPPHLLDGPAPPAARGPAPGRIPSTAPRTSRS